MYLWEVFLIKKYNNSKLERRQIIKFLPKKWSVAFTQYHMLTYFYSTFWRSDLRTWSVSRTHAHQKNLFRWNLSLSLTQRFKKFSISYFLWGILTKTLTTKKMGLRSNPRRTFFSLSLLSILVFLLFTSFALAQVSLSLYAYMWCLLVIVIEFVVNFRSSSLILTRKSLLDPKIWVAVARFVCVYFYLFLFF